MRVCVIGTGYVGLVSAAGFADAGHEVVGVDTDERKVRELGAGVVPIYEPELEDLVRRGLESGRLAFTSDVAEGVRGSEVIFICVGTPSGPNGEPDLSAVFESARAAVGALTGPALVVVKSTVPVGTTDRLTEELAGASSWPVEVASNPEFLKEGGAVEDFLRPDRVVIGVRTERAAEVLNALYEPFVRTGAPIIRSDPRSAEMGKYAANGMLASRISFMNEVARLCDVLGADVESVRRIVGFDRRVGGSFLFPGCGYGGSCFPKDVRALAATGAALSVHLPLISAIEETNRAQLEHVLGIIRRHFGGGLKGLEFAVWGLSFKPRTDDVRESPALEVVRALLDEGAGVSVFDPAAMNTARAALGERASAVRWAADRYDAAEGADGLVLATEWPEFRRPDPQRLARAMRGRAVFDGRNVLDGPALAREGFTVYGVGRPVARPAGE